MDADAVHRRPLVGRLGRRCAIASSSRCRRCRTCSRRCARRTSRSARAGQRRHDPLGEVLIEVNALADTLRDAAPGRARSERAAAHGDGGDPRRRVRVRSGSAAAAREPRRRAAARAARRAAARPRRRRRSAWRPSSSIEQSRHHRRRRSPAAPAAGRCGTRPFRQGGSRSSCWSDRRQPVAARRGAPGVAAADSRHRPRDQQLARADQVDRAQPRAAAHPRPASRRTGRATCAAACRSIGIARRFARPLHRRLRAAGAPAGADAGAVSSWRPRARARPTSSGA